MFAHEEEAEPPDGIFAHGYGSDVELVENTTNRIAGPEEIQCRMSIVLDNCRYMSLIGPNNGRIFTRWRNTEKDSYRKRSVAVDRVFALNGRRKLKQSCSATVSRWGPEQALDKLVLWQQWHRWWIYCIPPDRALPRALLIPTKAVLPKNFVIGTVGNNDDQSFGELSSSDSESDEGKGDKNPDANSSTVSSSGDGTDVSFEEHGF